jgi:hypothetical protein
MNQEYGRKALNFGRKALKFGTNALKFGRKTLKFRNNWSVLPSRKKNNFSHLENGGKIFH